MTSPSITQPGAQPAHNHVQEMQQRVASAFGGEKIEEASCVYTRLREGLAAGTIGGMPLQGATVACMLELLERFGWIPSVNRFTRAMPHYPEKFGIVDLREVFSHLGFSSEEVSVYADEIEPARLPGLILVDGDDPLILDLDATHELVLIDPQTGQKQPFRASGKIELVLFERITASQKDMANKPWFGRVMRRFNKILIFLLAITFLINMMVVATSLTVMAIYDSVLPANAMDTLFAIVLGVSVAFIGELWLRRVRAGMIGRLAARLEYLIGCSIFAKLIALPMDMIANVPVGSQIARLKQFETIRDLITGAFVTVGLELPFVFLFTGFLFVMGGPLGFIPVALIAAYTLIALPLFPIVRRLSAEASELRSEQYRLMLDTLSNLRTIRSLGCENLWLERIAESTSRVARCKRKAQEANRVLSTLSSAAVPLTGGATVLIGALMVMEQTLTVGSLIGCMIVIWRIITPVQQAMLLLSRYADLSRQVLQLNRLMSIPAELNEEDVTARPKFMGAIGFERVVFRYQAAIESSLLGIDLNFNPGEFVAVAGSSGSGKTTFLRMILNLYQPQSGAVTIDGINVRQIPVSTLRAAVGYVPQRPASFHGTISQNLRLAAPNVSEEEIHAIAAQFGILETILELPNGFNSRLDEFEQMRMAQGLKQVLALMQALLRKPSILLLDEPAKTLDPLLESAFLRVMETLRGDTTIVMVTHRPSHMRIADRVVILERGQVVQNGPPEDDQQRVSA